MTDLNALAAKDRRRIDSISLDHGTVEISWPAQLSEQDMEDLDAWFSLLATRELRRARAEGRGE